MISARFPSLTGDVSPTVVSQHLAKLRLAGLVKGRREGTFVYYSPADDEPLTVLGPALFGTDAHTVTQ